MKAIAQDTYGSADVLELRDLDTPAIGDEDVLVRVRAASVDRGVWHLMTGMPYLLRVMGFGLRAPRTRVRGEAVAGSVEAVGKEVTQFQPGDEVFGVCEGAFAEYARARPDNLSIKPASLTFAQAASVPNSGLTALQALRDAGQVTAGQSVLIIGASGAVGRYAVQLAKASGAEVTGVCSTGKLDLVSSLGADHVIDYTREDLTRTGRRWDVILDMAGNRPLSLLRRALTAQGTLVIIGGEGGDRWLGGVDRQLRAALLSPFVRHTLRPLLSRPRQADLQSLKQLIDAGKLKPVMDRKYPLAEAASAIRYLADGRARGNVVLEV